MTYWEWFWTDMYYSLLLGFGSVVVAMAGYAVWTWLEDREDIQERPEHFTRLF